MKSAKTAVQKALVHVCRGSLAALGLGPAAARVVLHRAPDALGYPFVVLGAATEAPGLHSDRDSRESDGTIQVRVYSRDADEAGVIADRIMEDVEDFAASVVVEGFSVLEARPAMRVTLVETDQHGDIVGEILTIRIRTVRLV